ncbi:hypothetical protein GCM10017673_13260 [Streptosporangium violaceochromogenes]|nr:hypothetical protein GCM10017673_13260 [Streptosporangium violaceochromogenes]
MGYTALAAGTAAMVGLHVATGLDPVHTVISEYAFEPDGWLLPVSLTFFAAGAVAFGGALARRDTDRGAAILVCLWGLCMLLIGAFPTDAPGVPLSMSGGIHRYAAFVAFLAMPVAGLILSRRHVTGSLARVLRLLSLASLGVLVLVVVPYVVRMFGIDLTDDDIPAGVTQRLVVGFEVAVLAALGSAPVVRRRGGRLRKPRPAARPGVPVPAAVPAVVRAVAPVPVRAAVACEEGGPVTVSRATPDLSGICRTLPETSINGEVWNGCAEHVPGAVGGRRRLSQVL